MGDNSFADGGGGDGGAVQGRDGAPSPDGSGGTRDSATEGGGDAASAQPDASPDGMPSAGGAVLFGGFLQGDTWSWNGTAWTKLDLNTNVESPGAREFAVMAPLGGKLVLFGGSDPGSGTYGDTWTWDGATWTDTHADASGSTPAPRDSATMAPLGGKLVLFGGENEGALYGDTWTWDGTAWSLVQVAGPPAVSGGVMAPFGGKLVLFGGGAASDTWTWDGTAWTQVSASGPPPRSDAVMAPLNGKLYLFGGLSPSAKALSDTWMWDGTTWTQLDVPGPSARSGAAMTAFDGELVLYAGMPSANGSTSLGDTWTWNGTAWTQQSAAYHPAAEYGSVMAVR